MKKLSLLAFVLVALTGSLHATDVYLTNTYGGTIKYKFADPLMMVPATDEHPVPNRDTIRIGDLNDIQAFSIRTTGWGSSYVSRYSSLMDTINQIRREEHRNPNRNAIIKISYTAGGLYWDPIIHWISRDIPLH